MKTSITKRAKLNRILKVITVSALWLGLWFLISAVIDKEILFVSPYRVVLTFGELIKEKVFWQSALMSIYRIMLGFVTGMLFGIVCSVVAHRFELFRMFITPFFNVIRATPVASFIILAWVWISDNSNIPIFICFLMVSPIVWGNVTTGLYEVDSGLIDVAKVFKFGWFKRLKLVYIPSVMPYILSAATTSLGLSLKSGIAAEVLCTPKFSIGKEIYNSKIYLETPKLFAYTTLVVLISILLEKVILMIVRRGLKKYNVGGDKV